MKARRFSAPLAVILVLVFAPSASATTEHTFDFSFGPFLGEHEGPQSPAVDQTTGNVYVVNTALELEKFGPTGSPVAFSALGSPPGTSNVLAGTGFNYGPDRTQFAIAPPGAAGGTEGDIYVASPTGNEVEVFASTGAYLGSLTRDDGKNGPGTSYENIHEATGVAVDGAGNIYVTEFSHEKVLRFTPTANPPINSDLVSTITTSPHGWASEVAADSEGHLYVNTSQGPVDKYNAFTGEYLGRVDPHAVYGLAVDPSNNDLYLAEHGQVAQYNSAGELLTTFGSGIVKEAGGVGVYGPSPHYVYVADRQTRLVDVFDTPPPPVAPSVDATSVSEVADISAEFHVQINPGNTLAHYHFEYITDAAYQANLGEGREGFAGALRVPTEVQGDATIDGSYDQGVVQHVADLLETTEYHYRAVVSNGVGLVTGPADIFVTQEGFSAQSLPDERAYELVSPVDKNGGDVNGFAEDAGGDILQAAADGESVTYSALASFASPIAAPSGGQYLSSRGSGGWSTENIFPPMFAGGYGDIGTGVPYRLFSTDLSEGLVINGHQCRGIFTFAECMVPNLPIAGTEAPAGFLNYYLRDNTDAKYRALLTTSNNTLDLLPEAFTDLEVEGATSDLAHILLSTCAALTSDATQTLRAPGRCNSGTQILYEWTGSKLYRVSVLPNGNQSPQASFEGESDAISPDGSSVVWTGPSQVDGNASSLYLREGIGSATPTTVEINSPQGGTTSSNKTSHPVFQAATWNGGSGSVFFTSSEPLTKDANTGSCGGGCPNLGNDLYRFDVGTGALTDLTPDSSDENGAQVQGPGIFGASEDGSYIYFVADGKLAAGATAGQPNLYLLHGGAIIFIATLSSADGGRKQAENPLQSGCWCGAARDWTVPISRNPVAKTTTRVTPDGRHLAFMSQANLTGYENAGQEEVFVYDASANGGAGQLTCASCSAVGPPSAPSSIPPAAPNEGSAEGGLSPYRSRALSDDGRRLFFDSESAFVPQDTNRKLDVYEWEAQGSGSCRKPGGCISLISSGTSNAASYFVDASASGSDVFFNTASSLVSNDPGSVDMYDAREHGGFPSAPAVAPCEGDACHTPATAPSDPTPGSSSFNGPGNASPGEAGKPLVVKKKHKATKKKHRVLKGRRSALKHRARRAARHNREGSK
jgi:hypothetical protein